MRRRSLGGLALTVVLVVALAIGSAAAQEAGSQTLQLTPSQGSGVSGTATFTDTNDGVQVDLEVQGLPEDGVEHLAHIHEGATCADDRAGQGGPVEFPLESVVAEGDTGASTTVIPDVTVSELFSGEKERYVNVHAEQTGDDVPPGVACADVASAAEEDTAGDQYADDDDVAVLPDTGGAPLAALAAGLLALGLGGLLLKRRFV
jgi:LPXTG-motif cell wall-anchored protein